MSERGRFPDDDDIDPDYDETHGIVMPGVNVVRKEDEQFVSAAPEVELTEVADVFGKDRVLPSETMHPILRPDAMQGLATGNRDQKNLNRLQRIHTPQAILDICDEVWDGGIALDPCASPDVCLAQKEFFGRGDYDDGLKQGWVDYAYINPPYKSLKDWLEKSAFEKMLNLVTEQILLFPVRTNRKWFLEYLRAIPTQVAWLKGITFKGYSAPFPAPLVLVYTGDSILKFETACYASGLTHLVTGPLR